MMDVPILSGWVKQSINSAMEVYVAPRSISLDLGLMLAGGERVDTEGVGVVAVRVISASKFRAGDRMNAWKNIVPGLHASARERQGDSYVTVGWGKWGKPLASTRFVHTRLFIWNNVITLPAGLLTMRRCPFGTNILSS